MIPPCYSTSENVITEKSSHILSVKDVQFALCSGRTVSCFSWVVMAWQMTAIKDWSNSLMHRNFKALAGQIGPNLTHKSSRALLQHQHAAARLHNELARDTLSFTASPIKCLIPNSCFCFPVVHFVHSLESLHLEIILNIYKLVTQQRYCSCPEQKMLQKRNRQVPQEWFLFQCKHTVIHWIQMRWLWGVMGGVGVEWRLYPTANTLVKSF